MHNHHVDFAANLSCWQPVVALVGRDSRALPALQRPLRRREDLHQQRVDRSLIRAARHAGAAAVAVGTGREGAEQVDLSEEFLSTTTLPS